MFTRDNEPYSIFFIVGRLDEIEVNLVTFFNYLSILFSTSFPRTTFLSEISLKPLGTFTSSRSVIYYSLYHSIRVFSSIDTLFISFISAYLGPNPSSSTLNYGMRLNICMRTHSSGGSTSHDTSDLSWSLFLFSSLKWILKDVRDMSWN